MEPTHSTLRRVALILGGIAALVLIAAAVAVKQQTASRGTSGSAPSVSGTIGVGAPSFERAKPGRAASEVFSDAAPSSTGTLTERKITKNGNLSLLVRDAESVASEANALAARLGGFVVSSQIYEVRDGVKTGSISIRVPVVRFDDTMKTMKALALRVEQEIVQATDVTEQFVDLEARLKNSRAEEVQFLAIMKQADTVEETLSVVQHLNRVRGEIEYAEGQLQFLSRQVEMSTISASLTEEADAQALGIRWRPLVVAKLALRDQLNGLSKYVDAMIRILLALPIIILWAATILAVMWVLWRIGRRVWLKYFNA